MFLTQIDIYALILNDDISVENDTAHLGTSYIALY